MLEEEITGLAIGIITTALINLIPIVNRKLDKITSSKGAQIAFYIIEIVEAFEDGKLTKDEVERSIDNLKLLLEDINVNEKNRATG